MYNLCFKKWFKQSIIIKIIIVIILWSVISLVETFCLLNWQQIENQHILDHIRLHWHVINLASSLCNSTNLSSIYPLFNRVPITPEMDLQTNAAQTVPSLPGWMFDSYFWSEHYDLSWLTVRHPCRLKHFTHPCRHDLVSYRPGSLKCVPK